MPAVHGVAAGPHTVDHGGDPEEPVIEDATQAVGATLYDKPIGT